MERANAKLELKRFTIDDLDRILREMEEWRVKPHPHDDADYAVRICQSIVADVAGYNERVDWRHLQTTN